MSDSKGETAPALGISLSLQYAGGRTVVFQTHVPQETPQTGIDEILDRLNGSADRAEAFYAQEQARRQLEVEEKALSNMTRRLSEVETNIQTKSVATGGRRNPQLSAQDEMQKKQGLDSVEESKQRVVVCKTYLADLIKKAGNRDGASSPANS
jgi:hypothetical protein